MSSSDPKRRTRQAPKRAKDDADVTSSDDSPSKRLKTATAFIAPVAPLTPPPSSPITGDDGLSSSTVSGEDAGQDVGGDDAASITLTGIQSRDVSALDAGDTFKGEGVIESDDTARSDTKTVKTVNVVPPATTKPEAVVSLSSRCNAKWSSELRERMVAILLSSHHRSERYNLYELQKRDTRWINFGHDANTQYLAVGAQPLTFWIVGEVDTRGAWLVGYRGSSLKSVSIRIRPVRDGEIVKWSALLKALGGHKVEDVTANGFIKARRRMTYHNKGDTEPSVAPFYECYDATRRMRPYVEMEKFETCNIGVNDLVVVDARLTRWMCDDKGTTKYYGEWTHWRLGFELSAVSILFRGPDEQAAEVPVATSSGGDFEF